MLFSEEIDDIASAMSQSTASAIDEIWGKDLLNRYGREKKLVGKHLLNFIYKARKSSSAELKTAIFRNVVDNHGTPTTQPVWWLEPMFNVIEVLEKQTLILRESMKKLATSVARAEAITSRNMTVSFCFPNFSPFFKSGLIFFNKSFFSFEISFSKEIMPSRPWNKRFRNV